MEYKNTLLDGQNLLCNFIFSHVKKKKSSLHKEDLSLYPCSTLNLCEQFPHL